MDGLRFDAAARAQARAARVVGVDEAGRGPLAGPVVAAAVILPARVGKILRGARDSKTLSASARERFYRVIRTEATAVSVAWAYPRRIEKQNILQASLAAMGRAAVRAAAKDGAGACVVLVDGPHPIREFPLPQRPIIDGDARSLAIGAASIVAKVIRDRWMRRLDRRHPGYGFADHKGYGTARHLAALNQRGPCAAHRRTYAPVAAATRPG